MVEGLSLSSKNVRVLNVVSCQELIKLDSRRATLSVQSQYGRRRCLRPMAGVTDTVFRRLIRNQRRLRPAHDGIYQLPWRSQHAQGEEAQPDFRYLYFEPEEHPISCQLFGSDPDVMAEAARFARIGASISSISISVVR